MFKKLEELLEAGKIDKEVAETVDAEIQTELKALREESAKYRTKLKEVESSYKAKLEEQEKELQAKLDEAKKAGESEIAAKYEQKLKEIEDERTEYAQKAQKALVEAKVNEALVDIKVTDPELARLYIQSNLEVEDEKLFVKVGDEKLTFENGVKKLFELKPSLLSSSGAGGSGAGGSTKSGWNKTYTKSEYLSLDPAKQAELLQQNPKILDELKDE